MTTRKRTAVSCMAILFVWLALAVASHAEETARPDWCRKGWVCVTVEEMSEDTIYKINLREQLAILKAKNSRFGWSVGCGVGIAAVIDEDYDVSAPPAGFCGVTFDFWRFR